MKESSTILIVDDQLSVRETLAGLLTATGYELQFASSGKEALAQMANINPDLILLDVMMPGMNGFAVCRCLKADQRWQHVPIILITVLDSLKDMVWGLDAGADEFLTKPVNSAELQARVRSMLRIKNQYDLLEKQRRELEASLHLNRKFSQVIAQHLEALEVLHSTGMHLMNDLETDSVLNLIFQTVLELIPEADGCVYHFVANDQQQLLPVVFSPAANTKMIYPDVGIEAFVRQAIETGKIVCVPDMLAGTPQSQPQLPNLRNLLVTPLFAGKRSVGTLSVYSSETNLINEEYQYVLSILANQAAVAIIKARSLKERELAKEQEKRAIQNLFQRYVNPTVVNRLIEGQEKLSLGGTRQSISVLFADIRGFTAFGESLAPEHLVEVLNKYLALVVEAVMAQDGTLDKFMGDAVMAFFNAPLPQPDHTLRAVRVAMAMQQAIATFNNTKALNHCNLSFGIGIHVGEAVIGNIGTTQQMNYTAIGDTVNLAKRLQENAKGGQVILSHATFQAIKETVQVRDLGTLSVKGRAKAEQIYELLSLL